MTFVKGEIPEGAKVFKPGQTGNPNGRPKGKSFKTILDELLDLEATEKDLEDEDIKKVFKDANHKITNREIMLARMVLRAKQDPDSKAAERLMNRVEGKPVETVHNKLELGTENKITISKDGDSISLKVEKQQLPEARIHEVPPGQSAGMNDLNGIGKTENTIQSKNNHEQTTYIFYQVPRISSKKRTANLFCRKDTKRVKHS